MSIVFFRFQKFGAAIGVIGLLILPQYVLHYAAEDEQGVHVEEYMPESPMHEHVGNDLPSMEIPRRRVEQCECLDHVLLVDHTGQEDKAVDDYKVLVTVGTLDMNPPRPLLFP